MRLSDRLLGLLILVACAVPAGIVAAAVLYTYTVRPPVHEEAPSSPVEPRFDVERPDVACLGSGCSEQRGTPRRGRWMRRTD